MLGNREGQWRQLAPTLGQCGWCPQTVSPNIEVATFYIFASFFFIGEKAKGWKISGLKPMRKLYLGYPRFLSIMNDVGKGQLSPPPQSEDSSRSTEGKPALNVLRSDTRAGLRRNVLSSALPFSKVITYTLRCWGDAGVVFGLDVIEFLLFPVDIIHQYFAWQKYLIRI